MIHKFFCLLILLAILLFTASCASNNRQRGSVIGALIGGYIGAKYSGDRGAIIGSLAGFFAGRTIGSYLDRRDREFIVYVLNNNRNGQKSSWVSNNNKTGLVEATPISTRGNCRIVQFKMNTTDGVKNLQNEVCKGRNGNWA